MKILVVFLSSHLVKTGYQWNYKEVCIQKSTFQSFLLLSSWIIVRCQQEHKKCWNWSFLKISQNTRLSLFNQLFLDLFYIITIFSYLVQNGQETFHKRSQ